MSIVFVDANIFLDAYRHDVREYLKLLPYLTSLGSSLFITAMVVREVERNRLCIYAEHYNSLQKPASNLPPIFPYFATDKTAVDAFQTDFNKTTNAVTKAFSLFKKEYEKTRDKNIEAIAAGVDFVTKTLAPLFTMAREETAEELSRARIRKEIGQPPGKKGDPLGDQISWEQLLVASSGHKDIWLVSHDSDLLFTAPDKSVSLNPTLDRELRAVSGVEEIHCFTQLGSFFDDYRPKILASHAPAPSPAETGAANTEIIAVTATPRFGPSFWFAVDPGSPCSASPDGKHFVPGAALYPSRYSGAMTFQGPCQNCRSWVDTLEDMN